MASTPKIWIVDDSPEIRFVFRRTLMDGGYEVFEWGNGFDALEQLRDGSPDLIILDVSMPQMDGWKTLRELRQRGYAQPVLMITAVNDVDSRVRGLDNGADDYVGKPCDGHELLARVGALLRRAPPASTVNGRILQLGDARIDLAARTATKAKKDLKLTRTDYLLLTLLNEHRGTPVSRDLILQRVWEGQAGGSHAFDTHIWRLRRKLGDSSEEPRWIRNVPGIGYVLEAGD